MGLYLPGASTRPGLDMHVGLSLVGRDGGVEGCVGVGVGVGEDAGCELACFISEVGGFETGGTGDDEFYFGGGCEMRDGKGGFTFCRFPFILSGNGIQVTSR